jgi:hypothetical protein
MHLLVVAAVALPATEEMRLQEQAPEVVPATVLAAVAAVATAAGRYGALLDLANSFANRVTIVPA